MNYSTFPIIKYIPVKEMPYALYQIYCFFLSALYYTSRTVLHCIALLCTIYYIIHTLCITLLIVLLYTKITVDYNELQLLYSTILHIV